MSCQACAGLGYVIHYDATTDMQTRRPCTWCQAPKRDQEPAVRNEGNVRILQAVTHLDIPIERILAGAGDADLKLCIVVGEAQDGSLYFASNKASGPDVLWALEQAKLALLKAGGAE